MSHKGSNPLELKSHFKESKAIQKKRLFLPQIIIFFSCLSHKILNFLPGLKSKSPAISNNSIFFPISSPKLVKFIRLLILIQRAIKNMRNRTKFRSLKDMNERYLEIIDDQSHFMRKTPKNSFSFFIRNKTLRIFFVKLRRFIRRNFEILIIISSSIYFDKNFN